MTRIAIYVLAAAGVAAGQTAAPPATFEVASVKVAEGGRRSTHVSPGMVTMQNIPLSGLVRWAWGLKEYQFDGPEWTTTQGYNITAKAAGPATEDELQIMMRALLTERFKLVLHHETKELPVYELTLAKGGSKMTASTTAGEPNMAGARGNSPIFNAERVTMEQLADLLSQPLQRPVIDKTGLHGGFDFRVDLLRYIPLDANGRPSAGAMEDRDSIIGMALQEELGLKLEPRKGPVEKYTVERAEKIPAEND